MRNVTIVGILTICLTNPPSDASIRRLYTGAGTGYGESDANWSDVTYGVHQDDTELFNRRAKLIYEPKLEWAEEFVKRGVYLDIACATGESVKAAQNLGWSATGMGIRILKL